LAVAAANFQPGLRDLDTQAALHRAGRKTIIANATRICSLQDRREFERTTDRHPMYTAITRDIEIKVLPRFLPERSSQQKGHFFWAYTISIINHGQEAVQLKTRHWKITDGNGRLQEVRGAGVVGEEPVLKSGESFEYTSGVPLQTPSGFMTGSYGMVSESGELFDVEIPAFSLDLAESARTLN
jgi:ApaG protein